MTEARQRTVLFPAVCLWLRALMHLNLEHSCAPGSRDRAVSCAVCANCAQWGLSSLRLGYSGHFLETLKVLEAEEK